MIETFSAALGLLVCVALLLRMALPARWRTRLDGGLASAWSATRARARRLWGWRARRREAARAAEDLIRRARGSDPQSWDGNVYRPKSFRRPRKPH